MLLDGYFYELYSFTVIDEECFVDALFSELLLGFTFRHFRKYNSGLLRLLRVSGVASSLVTFELFDVSFYFLLSSI